VSEAYEIGVTLALSDGVSEGIERARRDMVQFETALASGGVTVQQLRRAAVGAVVPPTPPRAQPAPKPEVRPAERAADVVKADVPAGANAAEVAIAPRWVSGAAAGDPGVPQAKAAAAPVVPAVVREANVAPAVVRETNVASAVLAAPSGAPAAAPRMAGRGEAARVAAAPLPQVLEDGAARFAASAGPADVSVPGVGPTTKPMGLVQVFAAAPVALPKVEVSPATATVPVAPSASLQGAPTHSSGPPVGPLGAASRTVAGPVSVASAVRFSAPGDGGGAPPPAVRPAPAPERHDDGAAERVPPFHFGSASPTRGGPPGVSGGAPDAGDGGGKRSAAPSGPPAAAQSQGPTGGDVFLDGMLVGRWIARFLADGAGRAPAGPTGFDGRRGRVLPGPTVGG
jgi:hypothetical protein